MEPARLIFVSIIITMTLVQRSWGHGYMIEPPSRSSMWRVGFNTPINYDDNGVRCGISNTNCRVCGDKANEAGGKYATGTMARTFSEAQNITLTVIITSNHLGYFQFGLCPNNNISRPVTEECLQQHVLELEDGSTKYKIKSKVKGPVTLQARLPQGVTCSQCVLRWYWKTGNSWGVDPKTGEGCLGCGTQEQFFSCADVSISPRSKESSKEYVSLSEESPDEDVK